MKTVPRDAINLRYYLKNTGLDTSAKELNDKKLNETIFYPVQVGVHAETAQLYLNVTWFKTA